MEKQSVEEKTSANNLTSSKLYENERSIEMSNDSQLVEQSSITAMQTSLILMKLEMIKPSMENAPSTNSEKAFPCIEENTRMELPSMKFTISCDTITTQAATPYSSSMSTSTLVPSRDILQISAAPLSSIGSIPKSEILTFTTDYNNRSPDACSVLVDVVDQHDPSSTFNRDVQLSIEESFDLPQRSISSVRNDFANRTRQSRQTWRFGKCLCCTAPIDDEVSMFYFFQDLINCIIGASTYF
ncbi:PREDICTED: uncharacterized protein LOC107067081 [Polistes dominula]|uniref:Uncharacterized protein LOC107067081 n=1 Tax=Polistes dominula TaxID=743375 RepID=A0ABM1IC23_POLDO|nr:PREDICTED: uncharacterized protein LOC107067081 [Polistes dominula]